MFKNAFDHFPTLITARLRLRKITRHDLQALHAVYSNDEVSKQLDIDTPKEVAESIELTHFYLRQYLQQWGIRWGIERLDTDGLIGTIGFHEFDSEAKRAEIGYELAQDHWRQGLMSEAAGAVLAYGFEQANLNRIEAATNSSNRASAAMLIKLGFVQEGTLRQRDYYRGQPNDARWFGLLREAWRNHKV